MRILISLLFLLAFACVAFAADVPAKVFVNGKLQTYNPPAITRDGKTYVPLRQGAQSLGYTVEWLPAENAAKVCDDKSCLLIRKAEGITLQGSMFLPLRHMGESFGAKVRWDPKSQAVIITK
jgi:hypothetical protein